MSDRQRPNLNLHLSTEPVDTFVRGLQQAIDAGDADLFNLHFAQNVFWGSPFGAVASGYEQIHAIHSRMFSSVVPVPGASRYTVEQVSFPVNSVALAYVRRAATHPKGQIDQKAPGAFDELALFVLVEHDGEWWLAAAQHVPHRRDVYLLSDVE